MRPTDELPILFADRVQSLNYSGPTPPAIFAAAGTSIDLATGTITSTGLVVNGTTGDLAVRGDIDAASLTLLDTLGNVIATFDDTSTAYSLGTHALTLGTGGLVANQGLYWSGGTGTPVGLASRSTSATLGELGTGLDLDPENGATLDYEQASATPLQTIGARFRSTFLGANLAVATAAQASVTASGDTGSRVLLDSAGDVYVYASTSITLLADGGAVSIPDAGGLDVTAGVVAGTLRADGTVRRYDGASFMGFALVDASYARFDTSAAAWYFAVPISPRGLLSYDDGTQAVPEWSFRLDPDTGIFRGGSGDVRVSCNNVTGMIVQASNFYARGVWFTATASATDVRVIGSDGRLGYFSSSLDTKTDIEPLDLDRALALIDGLEPIWYRSTNEVDRPDWSHYGFAAEHVADLDPRLVGFDENGKPITVAYSSMVVPLVAYVRALAARVAELESSA